MGYNSNHSTSKATREKQKAERLGEERLNNQGCLMRVIEYNKAEDIVVEFQDKYKGRVNSRYKDFVKGSIKNPYHPNIYGGMIGSKYSAKVNEKISKEYFTWKNMLLNCAENIQDVCCEEWLLFENFYEWLHGQSNFDKFLNGNKWTLNKNIIVKDNKVYSPETCCLVSQRINQLFIKQNLNTNGVSEKVLQEYKEHKEKIIKRIAEEEFANGNITEKCYKAMIVYKVEIDD